MNSLGAGGGEKPKGESQGSIRKAFEFPPKGSLGKKPQYGPLRQPNVLYRQVDANIYDQWSMIKMIIDVRGGKKEEKGGKE